MKKEVQDEVAELLPLVAKEMKKVLKQGETTAAQWNAIINLLKHCGVSGLPVPGSDVGDLADTVKTREFPFAINGAILEKDDPAVKAMGSD